MRKNLLKPLFVAAFGMMACLGANAQNSVSNAEPDMTAGNEFWGSYFQFSVVQKVSGDASAVTYDVNIIGLSGSEAGDYQGDNLAEIAIPNTVVVGNNGVQYTLNVKSVAKLQNYSALETLSFDEDFAGSIAANAISGLDNLAEIIASPATAPSCVATSFTSAIYRSVKLTINEGTVKSYMSSMGWRKFFDVEVGGVRLGNVNNDTNLNMVDVNMLGAYVKGTYKGSVNATAADVNGDGNINMVDVNLLGAKVKGTI